MGAKSKRAQRVVRADNFDLDRLVRKLWMPRDGQNTIDAWSFREIMAAREEQLLGQFVLASRMAESMTCDDAIAVARWNRLAPQRCTPVELKPAPGARGAAIAEEAEGSFGPNGVGITPGTIANIHRCLVDHGIAFAANYATPREDGSRVDFEMHYWPIEYIRWDPVFRLFKARADPTSVQPGDIPDMANNEYGFVGGYWIPVVHGDGRWVIFSSYDQLPFRNEAAILPAALVWARHAFAARDWSQGSKAHGTAKVIGELPAGVPLQNANGISDEANAFISLLQAIAESNSPVGIRPAGSKTEFVVNTSTAWQVWSELISNAEKAAARIYLGTDGTLGSQGGAPGVDIGALFGVAKTKVRADLEAISRGIDTGVIQPWTAVNFGDSRLAPSRRYVLPNDELEAETADTIKRNDAFYSALQKAKQAGLNLSPEFIAALAADYRVRVPEFTPDSAAPAPAGFPT